MGRLITLTNRNDSFTQGFSANNVEIRVQGLDGRDTIILNRDDDLGGGNFVNAGDGADGVRSDIEQGSLIRLGAGNDLYVGLGFGSFATDAADTVEGGGGADHMAFTTFKSRYIGGAGNDLFSSVGWQNVILGGEGLDTVSYAPRGDDATQGGTGVGIDLLNQVVFSGGTREERLSSIENATGSVRADEIQGSAGANLLTGGGGLDALKGLGGADRFIYTRIADAKVFVDAADEIFDFTRAQGDKVDLRKIDANTAVDGNQSFVFISADAFSNAARQLRFTLSGGDAVVQGDVNGDGTADFQILLSGAGAVIASDFLL
jgi:serralysin